MQKIIEKYKEAIIEHYCDGCQKLIMISGIPHDAQPDTGKEISVALHGSFCYNYNDMTGLVFDHIYCNDCGVKLVKLIEREFKIKIETQIFANPEGSNSED